MFKKFRKITKKKHKIILYFLAKKIYKLIFKINGKSLDNKTLLNKVLCKFKMKKKYKNKKLNIFYFKVKTYKMIILMKMKLFKKYFQIKKISK